MCDLSTIRRTACHGSRLQAVKLSKWELPIPSSKSYWDGVCAEIEKNYKRVREPHPSFQSYSNSLPPSTKPRRTDDFKFKISPPTPMHKIQKSDFSFQLGKSNNRLDVPKDARDSFKTDIKLPPATSAKVTRDREKLKEVKVYPKQSCPLHKNISVTKIFDDEISNYIGKIEKSTPKLPSIVPEKKILCKRHSTMRSKSMSISSISSRESLKLTTAKSEDRRHSKPPKLGMASLLPSFAKPVSTDSSVGTHGSTESDEECPKIQSTSEEIQIQKRDFLRVPNLSFVSSHPSFRKLSFVDSLDQEDSSEISVITEDESLNAKENLKSTSEKVEEKEEKSDHSEKTILEPISVQKAYALKALNVLTKWKYLKKKEESDSESEKSSTSSEKSSRRDSQGSQSERVKRKKEKETIIDFKEVQKKLKQTAPQLLSPAQLPKSFRLEQDKTESVSIYSASRSTSGPSPDFANDAFEPADILKSIPKTKIFNRTHIDRCHACLFKPFQSPIKITRELPLATLKAVVDNPPEFEITTFRSSTDEEDQLKFDDESEDYSFEFDISPPEIAIDEVSEDKISFKDQSRVSFDEASITNFDSSPTSTRIKSPVEKTLSVQSSDRSKTSTPSIQSGSDSEDAGRPQDDKLPSSKYMAPCHAPVVWRKSFEPFKALKLKKFTSLQARAAAITAISSEGSSDSESREESETKPATAPEVSKDPEEQEVDKKSKPKKPLLRTKTVVEIKDSDDKKRVLKRAKTTFDLIAMSEESRTEDEDEPDEKESQEPEEKRTPSPEIDVENKLDSAPPQIMTTEDVMEIIKAVLEKDFNVPELMDRLSQEFAKRIEQKCKTLTDIDDMRYLKLGFNLFKTLIDSRRYLKSNLFDPNLKFSSSKQPPISNSRQLRRILPPKSYELVAPILGMPKYSRDDKSAKIKCSSTADSKDAESELSFGLYVHPPTIKSGNTGRSLEGNPYALFLKKPRRKAVVWRPLNEEDLKGYDPEATLEKRAARMMDRICKDFCDWMKTLGGNEQVIDEETMKDMFEINFSADACKAMQVVLKEMPTVPMSVAKSRNCQWASELEATRKEILKDIEFETRTKKTFAFGQSLPDQLRCIPPKSRVADKWLHCDNIPNDLDTMDVVWNGIMHLDSVRTFINFLKDNPKVASQKLLENLERRKINPDKIVQSGPTPEQADNEKLQDFEMSETESGL